jgi:hypothetical protein
MPLSIRASQRPELRILQVQATPGLHYWPEQSISMNLRQIHKAYARLSLPSLSSYIRLPPLEKLLSPTRELRLASTMMRRGTRRLTRLVVPSRKR